MRARDNPFSVERVLTFRYVPKGWDWDQLMARLKDLNYRAAIVGPEGAGKTTLMEDLFPRLRDIGLRPTYLALNRQRRRFEPGVLHDLSGRLTPADIVCFDGCEQMGYFAWRRFVAGCRRAGGLLVTTHRSGRLPTLVECKPDPAILRDIVRALLPGEACAAAMLDDVYRRHHGNIRLSLRELYDVWADK
jgi:hypothetical protein